MKILFFAPPAFKIQTENKGSGNWVSSLLFALKKYSSDAQTITVAVSDPNTDKIELDALDDVMYAKMPSPSKQSYYQSVIQMVEPDIIQLFGLEHSYSSILGSTKIPVVIHLQGMIGPYSIKDKSNQRFSKSIKIGSLREVLKQRITEKKRMQRLAIEESSYQHAKYFFGRTDWDRYFAKSVAPQAEYMVCQEIMRSQFYDVIWSYPGDLNHSSDLKTSKNNTFQIYSTLSGSPRKNVDIIYRADQLLRTYHPTFQVKWNIGGLDTSSDIYQAIRKSGLGSDRIELLGRLNASEIIEQMNASHLYVFPSAIDNSPNSLQEAMLIGMPVLATHAGGVSSLIEHEKTGILIPEGEPYALAGAVAELSGQKEKLLELGRNARAVALTRNSPKNVVESLLDGYKKMLNQQCD